MCFSWKPRKVRDREKKRGKRLFGEDPESDSEAVKLLF